MNTIGLHDDDPISSSPVIPPTLLDISDKDNAVGGIVDSTFTGSEMSDFREAFDFFVVLCMRLSTEIGTEPAN